MHLTTKGRYAVRVMADIARKNGELTSLADISARQDVSVKYLEKIISMLAQAGLVEGVRGVNGGYRLSRSASEITIKQILDATGDNTCLASCLGGENCPRSAICDTREVWDYLTNLINGFLQDVTLQNVLDKNYQKNK